jgi:hypothetical protein
VGCVGIRMQMWRLHRYSCSLVYQCVRRCQKRRRWTPRVEVGVYVWRQMHRWCQSELERGKARRERA